MSFILVPNQGCREIKINGWNWRPTLVLIRSRGLIDQDMFERMGTNGCEGRVDAITADRISKVIEAQLNEMKPGERMLLDLSVTSDPKPDPSPGIYSAEYKWLRIFAHFCRRSGGFLVL
jgi:hypothetical protein